MKTLKALMALAVFCCIKAVILNCFERSASGVLLVPPEVMDHFLWVLESLLFNLILDFSNYTPMGLNLCVFFKPSFLGFMKCL